MLLTYTVRLCFWHPWKMRRRWLYHPVELVRSVRSELNMQVWEHEHGYGYYDVPEWAWPVPVPGSWWTLYRCLVKGCDGLFYHGEETFDDDYRCDRWMRGHSHLGGLNVTYIDGHRVCRYCGDTEPGIVGWNRCPECGCGNGAEVAHSVASILDGHDRWAPEPWLRARMDQSDAERRDKSRWLNDGHRKILGVF